MARPFHLVQYLMPPVQHHSMVTWKHPRNWGGGLYDWDGPEIWQQVARVCEAAKYDAIFLADTEGIYSEWQGSPAAAVRYAAQAPCFEPSTLISFMGAVTRQLGLAITLTTMSYPPYVAARKLATLDHLSRGRSAWNVVTSFHHAAFQNLGIDEILDHDTRYDRADEYLEVCYALWDSWEPGAVVMDVARDMFADPTRVHEINFEGKWFRCRGPLNVHRCPQGRPVIVQAGASPRGISFAARHAEMIFSVQSDIASMRRYYDDVKGQVVNLGRDPDSCKIMFAAQVFVGETEGIAREKADLHNSMVSPEAGLVWLSSLAGADYSPLAADLDAPASALADLARPGIQGSVPAPRASREAPAGAGAGPSLRDVATRAALGAFLQIVGSAQQVADQLAERMASVGGDGFFLSPAYVPGSTEEFATQVVPILQRAGLVRTEYTGRTLRENLLAF